MIGFVNPSSSRLQRIGSSEFHGSALRQIEIPNSVEVIDNYCFYSCAELQMVTFGPITELKLKVIGARAFCGTSLKSIALPNSVEVLGVHCLSCASLERV
jgi:hypothetical protein